MEGGGGRGSRIGWIKYKSLLTAFGPRLLLTDLTRVKSVRACLPPGRRVRARPGRRGRVSCGRDSCLPALRLRAVRSGLTICHWQIVRAALTPLPAGAAAFGNRTRQTSTGRLLSGPLALDHVWSAYRANSAPRSSATNASASGPSNGPANRPSRRAASKKPGAGRPPRSLPSQRAARKGRSAAASSAISASSAPVSVVILPGPGMARRRASAP